MARASARNAAKTTSKPIPETTSKITKPAAAKPKKAAQNASKAKATAKKTTSDSESTKPAPKKAGRVKKTPTAPSSRNTSVKPKASGAESKTPANISRKRKSDDTEEEKQASPPAKKVRPTKTATKKPKTVINTAPAQRLDVYVFGEGSSSELGLGTAKTAIDVKRPRLNPLLSSKDVGVVHVACGGMHVAALTHDNKILTWGVNDQGALGRETMWEGGLKNVDDNASDDSDKSDSGLNPLESNPTAIPASSFPEGTTFVKLSAGDSHTLALTDDGFVYGWGCFRVCICPNFSDKAPLINLRKPMVS